MVGSMFKEAGDIGKKLLGSPAFAMPLKAKGSYYVTHCLLLGSTQQNVRERQENFKI